MLDFDKMTVAEHEAYKEMQRKAELLDEIMVVYGNTDKSIGDLREVLENAYLEHERRD